MRNRGTWLKIAVMTLSLFTWINFFVAEPLCLLGTQVRALPPPLTAIKCVWINSYPLGHDYVFNYFALSPFDSTILLATARFFVGDPSPSRSLSTHLAPFDPTNKKKKKKKVVISESIEDSAESHAEKSDSLPAKKGEDEHGGLKPASIAEGGNCSKS